VCVARAHAAASAAALCSPLATPDFLARAGVKVYSYEGHGASVQGVAWAPHEYGLQLACASADGTVSVLTHNEADNSWHVARLADSPVGCLAVSWAPAAHVGGIGADPATGAGAYVKRLAVAGADGRVRLHRCLQALPEAEVWQREAGPTDDAASAGGASPHREWVRDVAWSPASGVAANTLASCSDDGAVAIWSQAAAGARWEAQVLPAFESAVWRVSWSVTGHLLAVSCADNSVTLWKQGLDGRWGQISAVPDPSRA
jgi:protein transport protein SEC13